MITPSYVQAVNVKFDGTTSQSVVLQDASNIQSLVVWDDLSEADQITLDAFVVAHGGAAPLAAPQAGSATAVFTTAAVAGNATGLQNVATATAGRATVNVGGAKSGASATGLLGGGTAGSQAVNFTTSITGGGATGLNNGTAATAGRQDVVYGAITGATATGLANDATAYTATITVNGTGRPISVVGSAAQTFTTLLAEINTDLGATATAALFGGNTIRITSATSGAASTIAITNTNLFNSVATYASTSAAVPGAAAIPATTYTATVTVNGTARPISILGSAAQTFTTLVNELNADLGATATAAITGGDIVITSATVGSTSRVAITAGTLFPALTGYSNLVAAVAGTGYARTYKAIVTVDGTKQKNISIAGTAAQTYTTLLSELNADLGADATAAITGGNLTITSTSTGLASSVAISDTGFLFASLTNYVGVSSAVGTAPRVYTATVTVDGTARPITVQGSAAQTFTNLIAQINTDLGATATAAIVSGSIKITSATTGVNSSVKIVDGDLFKSTNGYGKRVTSVAGIANLLTAFLNERSPSGARYVEVFRLLNVGDKPAVLPNTPKTIDNIYYNGTEWVYLADDTPVCA